MAFGLEYSHSNSESSSCQNAPKIVYGVQVSFTGIAFFCQRRDSTRDVKLAVDTVASALSSCCDRSFKTEE